MSLFSKRSNDQAYLKMGIMGFAGDGKTYTATSIAIGLVELMRQRKLPSGDLPVYFIDTETGSDWVKPRFEAAGIELLVAKTRAFPDLVASVTECEKSGSVLLIDSISHFWKIFLEEYSVAKKRTRGLEFQDWAWLKKEWGRFTDRYVNSSCHIIMCGRASYEYDFFENQNHKKELIKTGIKMRAEGETAFEPSLLIQMESERNIENDKMWNTALVVKDRSTKINGKKFINPTFKDFLPHIECLNLCGPQVGIDTTRNNSELFIQDGSETKWYAEKQAKEVALDEIGELLAEYFPGATLEMKRIKADMIEKAFGTRSWEKVKTLNPAVCQEARNQLWLTLKKQPYQFLVPNAVANVVMAPMEDIPQ